MQSLWYEIKSQEKTGHGTVVVFQLQKKRCTSRVGEQITGQVFPLWRRKSRRRQEQDKEREKEEEEERSTEETQEDEEEEQMIRPCKFPCG